MAAVPVLARRNSTVKFAVALALSLALVLVIDPLTPLLCFATTLAAGALLERVPLRTYARALVPLVAVGAGFVWTNAFFATTGDGPAWQWGPLRASAAGFAFGLAIALRGLAIGALSLTFVLTTDPTDLAISLVVHARLPFRIVYALLAAYRFLPFFAQEYEQVRLAQRVRGAETGLPARLLAGPRTVVPLLAGAVRRATRIGVAMDARGFAAADARSRTYFRDVPLGLRDAYFALATLAVFSAIFTLSAMMGWLRFWDGRFAA